MKKIIYGFLAGVMSLLPSCADSYLDLSPENQVTPNILFASPDDGEYAINALGRLMVSQYLSSQGLNGEGTIALYYGEYPGDGLQKSNLISWSDYMNQVSNTNPTALAASFGWTYYYRMIGNANLIIENIPEISDLSTELQEKWSNIKAQALVYRAYSYLRLVQLYSRRWSDKQGESRGVVLRTTSSTEAKPCSTLKEVYQQIYADLDEAISLFQFSGIERSDNWLPSEEVAHAVYSRAALNREDWSKASSEATLAYKKSKLMTSAQYQAGFNTPNDEWIWSAFNSSAQDIYYYSFFSYCGANSTSSSNRNYPLEISKQLVDRIPSSDSRLELYGIPTEDEFPVHPAAVVGAGSAAFTKESDIKELENQLATTTDAKKKQDIQNELDNITPRNAFYNRVKARGSFLNGRIVSNGTLYYYIATKFQSLANPGVGNICLFRMAEMLYNEAEAEYRLGNESAAIAALEKAVKPYQPDYSCSLHGEALLKEICTYRAFDLWGEGFNWFDLKRRGEKLDRKGWADGGNWNSVYAIELLPTDANNWTKIIPVMETNYNSLVTAYEGN